MSSSPSSSTSVASLFEKRAGLTHGDISSTISSGLQKLAVRFQATPSDIYVSWERIALSESKGQFPASEAELELLSRELNAKFKNKVTNASSPTLVTSQTFKRAFPSTPMTTPPSAPKRAKVDSITPSQLPKSQATSLASKGKVVIDVAPMRFPHTFNEQVVTPSLRRTPCPLVLQPLPDADTKRDAYMYARTSDVTKRVAANLEAFCQKVLESDQVQELTKAHVESEPDLRSLEEKKQAFAFDKVGAPNNNRTVMVRGRIVCDPEATSLTASSLELEGTNGMRVKLDLTAYEGGKFSLFPGQFVVVEGHATDRASLKVRKFYSGQAQPPPSKEFPAFQMWVASGPYTPSTNLSFSYLDTLIDEILMKRPDHVMLLGPFVDANHPEIATGRCTLEVQGETLENVGFDDILYVVVSRLGTRLMDTQVTVTLISSTDDATHTHLAFPQTKLALPVDADEFPLVQAIPNPCVATFAGAEKSDLSFSVGVANIDAFKHFIDEGSVSGGGYLPTETWPRLATQLLSQRSFYPMNPAPIGACVDYSTPEKYALPPVDILITPSVLQSYAAIVDGVLCINPGKGLPRKTRMTVASVTCAGSAAGHEGAALGSRSRVDFFSVGETQVE